MGSGGGPSTNTTKTIDSPPSWAIPYAKELLSAYSKQVFPNGPSGGPAPLNPISAWANKGIEGLTPEEQKFSGQAQNQNAKFAAGDFVGPNPFLDSYYRSAAQPMIAQYQDAIAPNLVQSSAQSGTLGSKGTEEGFANAESALSSGLGDLGAKIYEPAYQQGMQQMQQAIGMSPELMQSSYLPSQMLNQAGMQAQLWPYQELGFLGQGLGSAIGKGGTSVSVAPNPQQTMK